MDALTLNYRLEGSGPPLLLVHGFGISFNIWQHLLPLLRPHFTLVMVELPGIGQSPMPAVGETYLCACADALERLRLALGLETWGVLGYSTGSRVAESYVQTYTAQVSRAVFLCPLVLDPFKMLGLRFGFWVDRFLPAIGTWLLSNWRLKFFISLFGFNLKANPNLDEWYAEIGDLPVQPLKATLQMLTDVGAHPFSVDVPFAMIWGDEDMLPIAPRQPGRFDHFVHANHAAPVVATAEVAQRIISIFEQGISAGWPPPDS